MNALDWVSNIFKQIFSALPFFLYAIILVVFVVYSIWGLFHLKNYGYVGDACQKVIIIYTILSALVIFLTITALII